MAEKIEKIVVDSFLDNYNSIMQRANFIIKTMKNAKRVSYDFSVDRIDDITKEFVTLVGYDGYGDYDSVAVPREYFHDDKELSVMVTDYEALERARIAREAEDQAYYKKITEEDEKRKLKQLMKKYPDEFKRLGGK